MSCVTRKFFLSFAFFVLYINSASAITVEEYQQAKVREKDALEFYIYGLGRGFFWSNIVLMEEGQKPFYCPPEKIALNVSNYMSVIDKRLSSSDDSNRKDLPIALVLYFGLADTFPC